MTSTVLQTHSSDRPSRRPTLPSMTPTSCRRDSGKPDALARVMIVGSKTQRAGESHRRRGGARHVGGDADDARPLSIGDRWIGPRTAASH